MGRVWEPYAILMRLAQRASVDPTKQLVPRDGTTADGCVSMVRNGLSSAQALVAARLRTLGKVEARPDRTITAVGGGRGRQSNLAASPFPLRIALRRAGTKGKREPPQGCLRTGLRAWSTALPPQ
jgi:hypothetical protein